MELADRRSLFQILAFLDGKLPLYSSAYAMVKAALLSSTNPSHQFRVYFERNQKELCQGGDDLDDYTVIIGTELNILTESNRKNGKVWKLTGWALEDQGLFKAIIALKEMNWDEDFVAVIGKDYSPDPYVERFLISKNGQDSNQLISDPINQFYLSIKQALTLPLSIPENVYVKSLEQSHIQTVYDHWPYRKETSVFIMADEVEKFPSAGVFLKATNELVSWAMYYPANGMSRVHTLVQYRGKGYASLVIRYLSKRVAQAGYLPTANVVLKNEASHRLFRSMGFQQQPWHINELIQIENE